MEDNINFNQEMLRDIVSSSIFNFLSSDNTRTATVDLRLMTRPHLTTKSKSYIDIYYGQDPEWIITVGHRSKSESKSSKAAQTASNSDILAA